MYYYCPTCGHHHGRDGQWIKCGAINHHPITDGASKCGCTGQNVSPHT